MLLMVYSDVAKENKNFAKYFGRWLGQCSNVKYY